ncbi:Butyrate--CoA ligase AAE11, peroxisomal [Acorus calamus]|uniref:Butyrate--CoA ligase AAE11, peroxisomal n=1 Tax=Acorus calamus TaxID=4465 RepID=A0AAV9DVB2_ACOCL|nr:Butyrate--CoA ligase AAE11, peroxisomal [Acorus calamus]
MENLPKCDANYVPLSPITFLHRAATVYADCTSIMYGDTRYTWKQTYNRCRRLASALHSLNISKNDVVSVLAPNVPAMYEMHFAVPMAGAVLNPINTLLNAKNIAAILHHSEAKAFFVDHQFIPRARDALKHLVSPPFVVSIVDQETPTDARLGELEYERLIAVGDLTLAHFTVEDEWDPIALNYTSGTTAAPKGVVYSHRGAYLSTLSLLLQWEVRAGPVYLWTLPMFHCNGWTFTWGVAARGGTNVCIRVTKPAEIYRAIAAHAVTHMCCAPTVLGMIVEARPDERAPLPNTVRVLTGGSLPRPAVVEDMERLGFHVTHAYGLTEATGPALVCEWLEGWDQLGARARAKMKARQGVSVLSLADASVVDPVTFARVPQDGRSVGEIALRGSSVMKGYYKDDEATSKAFRGGWFLTGDVAVVHGDGYIEIKDRVKDVIISGGENISSIEVEGVLCGHAKVVEAAVVAMPHKHWGETPCAFVVVKEEVEEEEMMRHCRENMAKFMVPKKVVFVEGGLPKTSTGKVQKLELRAIAKSIAREEEEEEEARKKIHEQAVAVSRL